MPLPPQSPAQPDPGMATAEAMASLIQDAQQSAHSSAPALPVAANVPFFLMHWGQEWQPEDAGLDETTWLPLFARHLILPGCNLNRTLARGEPPEAAYDMAVLKNTRRGATYLLPELHRLANGRKYLREAPCMNPRTGRRGTYWLEAWEIPRSVVPGKRLKFDYDRAGWNLYRRRMVHLGIIRAPSTATLSDLKKRRHAALARARSLRGLEGAEYKRRKSEAQKVVDYYEGAAVPNFDLDRAAAEVAA